MAAKRNDPALYVARVFGIVIVTCVAIGVVAIFQDRYAQIRELQARKRQCDAEILELKRMTAEVQRKKLRFRTEEDFVKRVARDLGLVCPNETVYQFVEPGVR